MHAARLDRCRSLDRIVGRQAQIHAAAEAAGLGMLEGTVSGNPTYIKSRNAAIFIGGQRDLFERQASILREITDKVTWVGPFGAGRVAKFVALYLVAVHTLAAAEAFELATQAGLDRASIFEALSGSNATSAMLESRGKHMIDRNYSTYNPDMHAAARAKGERPSRNFATRTRQLARLAQFAQNLGGRYPLLTSMCATYEASLKEGVGTYDIVEVFEYLMERGSKTVPEDRLIELLGQLS